jgi:opacity protein-like surface antigen
MNGLRVVVMGASLMLAAGSAQATDLVPDIPSEIETTNSGIYFRADAGWSFLEWSGGADDSQFVLRSGVGHQFNDFLRADLTADFSGNYEIASGSEISTAVVLGNVYLDWANDTPFTPYVGVGLGYGWVENKPNGLVAGLTAGVAVNITENLDFDVGYRFRDIMADGPDVIEHQATVGMRFKF